MPAQNTAALPRNRGSMGTKTRSTVPTEIGKFHLSRYAYYGLLALTILSFALIRFRLRDMPLERDEGEYAYAGQLILQGIPPYHLAYNMKFPGTYAAYSLILCLFGQTPAGIHTALLLLNAATTLMVYFLGNQLFGFQTGTVAAVTYALLSTSQSVLGLAGHASHLVVAAALPGVLLLVKAVSADNKLLLFFSGLMFGLAFLMKQPGALFIVFGVFYLVQRARQRLFQRNTVVELAVFTLGAALPFVLTCLILLWAGVIHQFFFWTFAYGRQYGGEESLADGIQNFLDVAPLVIGPSSFIWILAGLGITSPLWSREASRHSVFLIGFTICSFLAVVPGLYFREHYFVFLLPAVSLLAGVAIECTTRILRQTRSGRAFQFVPIIALALACGHSLFGQQAVLFELSSNAACRASYGVNPFVEAEVLGKYLEQEMSKNATLAVLGSEPEIYFYSHRHSATGYIYMYGLLERQKFAFSMQKQMIQEVEASQPEFLVYVDVPTSWLADVGSPEEISLRQWVMKFVPQYYEPTGIIDLLGDQTQYVWADAAQTYRPRSPYVIRVYRRRTAASLQNLGSDFRLSGGI